MNELFARLLNLNAMDLGAEGVRLGFERPFPAWLWPVLIVAILAASLWSYRRLEGPTVMRGALAILRALAITTLLVLIAGPRLIERNETVQRDWVVVLVDRSASMTIADAASNDGQTRQTREEQLRSALSRSWPMWNQLSRDRVVLWLGFDAGAYELQTSPTDSDTPIKLSEPTGQRTSLSRAIEHALQRAAARPIAGIVILSDGRSIDEPSRNDLRRLRAQSVPVFTVPLGSADPVGDLAISEAVGPGVAYVNDLAPVRVSIDRLGETARLGGVVRLIDKATDIVLDEQPLPKDGSDEIVLTTRPTDAGQRDWIVELVPDSPDLIQGNNRVEISVQLVDRPLRALYIDGVARWEQRYLKNLLLREKSITSSNLILAPNRRYIQEGDVELQSLPVSPEEWAEFDVVILGDVHPEVFAEDQLSTLREHVAVRGGGLIWIGGPTATPDAWRSTPLASLLPFVGSGSVTPTIGQPVVMTPTKDAARLGVLQLGETPSDPWPAEIADPASGWSALRWVQRIDKRQLKPATEVLATGQSFTGDESWPIVLSMRFGAGRVLYVATDEIWRWRYARGEALPERFWLQLVRLLGRESLSRSQRSAVLTVAPKRPIVGQPARVSIELLDESLIELDLASITVHLERLADPSDPDAFDAPLTQELTLSREPSQPRRYGATWAPTVPGQWVVSSVDPALGGLNLSSQVLVSLADDELRRPETDHLLLARLSDSTSGRMIEPDQLDELATLLPNRQLRLVNEQYQTLWDTPLALLIMVFLLSTEWIGRRIIRLV